MLNSNELIRFRGYIGTIQKVGAQQTIARVGICIDKSYRDTRTGLWVEKKKWVTITVFGAVDIANVERLKSDRKRIEAHCEYELREWADTLGVTRSADTFVARTIASYTTMNAEQFDAEQAGVDAAPGNAPQQQPARSGVNSRTKR